MFLLLSCFSVSVDCSVYLYHMHAKLWLWRLTSHRLEPILLGRTSLVVYATEIYIIIIHTSWKNFNHKIHKIMKCMHVLIMFVGHLDLDHPKLFWMIFFSRKWGPKFWSEWSILLSFSPQERITAAVVVVIPKSQLQYHTSWNIGKGTRLTLSHFQSSINWNVSCLGLKSCYCLLILVFRTWKSMALTLN